MKNQYELLAPVGNFPMLRAAIEAGADAVYLGLKDFNMRDSAQNFTISELKKIKQICKEKKVKVYLTLNVIIYDQELKRIEKLIKKIKPFVDAVICWDFSIISLCKKNKIPFHISTQASISNVESSKFFKSLGAEKIVLARELSLKQISEIKRKTKMQIECFCHGAMCVSVSGRCFTSQFLHGVSANRGQCSHPCRREYLVKEIGSENELKLQNNRVMSAKDLCTLPFIEKMKKAGINSFKIEGRNRSPEYVFNVVKAYRKALDKKLSKEETKELLKDLEKVYHRGFSTGFYLGLPTNDDFSDSKNGEQIEKKEYVGKVLKYWPKVKSASIVLQGGKIEVGNEIYIIGKNTGVKRIKIESIELKAQSVKNAKKGDEIGLFLGEVLAKKDDEVYLIKNAKE
jgi:putative protease